MTAYDQAYKRARGIISSALQEKSVTYKAEMYTLLYNHHESIGSLIGASSEEMHAVDSAILDCAHDDNLLLSKGNVFIPM